mgnify:CR=1 FL=1
MKKLLSILAFTVVLAACTTQTPPIHYDREDFAPVAETPDPPKPVKIVTVPEPLPLPGQLKPLPRKIRAETEEGAEPQARVDQAQAAASVEPLREGYVNAIQIYPYAEGALYRLYAAPERVSVIALQPGETIIAASAGDTVRWIIGDTVSGAGETLRARLLIKPIADDLETNLVIITDRRAYHLDLISTPETYMASVSWRYPHEELAALSNRNAAAQESEDRVVDAGVDLADLRFRYGVDGDEPPWRPVRVFDDGSKVYIQFPARLDQGEAPPLFVVRRDGEAALVNYRVRGRYYIVDRLFQAAELRLGHDPQQVVRIVRVDAGNGRRVSHLGGRNYLDPEDQ